MLQMSWKSKLLWFLLAVRVSYFFGTGTVKLFTKSSFSKRTWHVEAKFLDVCVLTSCSFGTIPNLIPSE